MTLNAEKFSQGMTTQQYMEYIKVNKQPFLDIYAATDIPADVQGFFNSQPQPLNLLVFTSDWCGDAMRTTPAILRLADSTDNLNLEVFSRDDELDLANSYLPENRAGFRDAGGVAVCRNGAVAGPTDRRHGRDDRQGGGRRGG